MGQHYMDPVQYLLGKDDTSPVKIEVDVSQQHPDAVGIWRRIVYTYEDGCQIVLEGEGSELGQGPHRRSWCKVYKDFECTIPDVMNKLAEMPDPRAAPTSLPASGAALRAGRGKDTARLDAGQSWAPCALRLNRTLHFDPCSQLFIGDDAANRLIRDQPMRNSPWENLTTLEAR